MTSDDQSYDATFAPLVDVVKDYYSYILPMEKEPLDKFDDVTPLNLQAYNRLAYTLNLKEDRGPKVMANYIASFTKLERETMIKVWADIQLYGVGVVRTKLQNAVVSNDHIPVESFYE